MTDSYRSRYYKWLRAFIGKKVSVNLDGLDADVEWDSEWDEDDEDSCAGKCFANTNYRDYMRNATDERAGWSIETGLEITIDATGTITDIEISAQVYGDDGLGDCYPDDEWKMDDYRCAKAFLQEITK